MDLDDVTSELYALDPGDFTARRTALAARARDDGQKDLAREIAQLRRPTVSAWLVNQLARGAGGAGDDVEELESVGSDLREAQARLDGPRMKELARRRQQVVAALVRRAGDVAGDDGQKVSAAVQRELEETFGAAVADEQACLAVTSGRLTRALVYAGLGEVDLTAATATALTGTPRRARGSAAGASSHGSSSHGSSSHGSSSRSAPSQKKAHDARSVEEKEAAARAAAAEAVTAAGADVKEADDDLAGATRHRDEVREREARLSTTLEDLQREIVRTRHELDDVTRSLAAAERDVGRRERFRESARKALRQAEEARKRLDP